MVMLVAGGWGWAGVAATRGQREGDNGSFNSGSSGNSPQAALVFSQITKPWYMELEPHEQHRTAGYTRSRVTKMTTHIVPCQTAAVVAERAAMFD